jgi:uncharacterized protein
MEQKAHSDPEIAKIMNANFVNIKVDREERPDIDSIYILFRQLNAGRSWPADHKAKQDAGKQ